MENNFTYIEPRRLVMSRKDNNRIITKSSYTHLMCPECFNMTKTHILNINYISDILDIIKDINISNEYYGSCPNCKADVKFEQIDANMGDIINILNNKGYYTKYCCEGHIETYFYNDKEVEMFTQPYISFHFIDMSILKSNPLPHTWYVEENNDTSISIYDNINKEIPKSIVDDDNIILDYIAHIGWLKNHWNKEEHLKDIYNWVISLPDKPDKYKSEARKLLRFM